MVRTCDQIKWPLLKGPTRDSRPTREMKTRKAKEKMRKTTSKRGPVSTSTAVREQPRTVRDGRRLSPMGKNYASA